MKMSFINMEGKYGDIDADYSSYHGYYIIKFSLSPYTIQADLCIYGKVIYYVEMVCEVTYFFPIKINRRYCVLKRTKSINTIISLKTIINGDVNAISYDSK